MRLEIKATNGATKYRTLTKKTAFCFPCDTGSLCCFFNQSLFRNRNHVSNCDHGDECPLTFRNSYFNPNQIFFQNHPSSFCEKLNQTVMVLSDGVYPLVGTDDVYGRL